MNAKGVDVNFDEVFSCIFQGGEKDLDIKLDALGTLSEEVLDEFLLYATQQGREGMIVNLIKRGANKNKILLGGSSLICYAIAGGMRGLVDFLVSTGVDLNKEDEDGATPLYEAVMSGDYEVARFLIASGADENKITMGLIPSVEMKKRGWIIEER